MNYKPHEKILKHKKRYFCELVIFYCIPLGINKNSVFFLNCSLFKKIEGNVFEYYEGGCVKIIIKNKKIYLF